MPASFAALESRVNSAVARTLSNRVATFIPEGGVGREIEGIFDDRYEQLVEDVVAGSEPAFTCLAALVPEADAGAQLVLDGITWDVVEPAADGTGMTVLRLRRAA